jgi:hypothetical protein
MNQYRPWGLVRWALSLAPARQWALLGALGTEQRSLAAFVELRSAGCLASTQLLEIHDPVPRFAQLAAERLAVRRSEFLAAGGAAAEILPNRGLLDELHKITAIATATASRGESIIVDISSLPKRYYFPVLRELHANPAVKDLLITYTSPRSYPSDRELSEGADDWLHLPGFAGPGSGRELLIAGVGFASENLQKHVGSIHDHEVIRIFIPFPAPLGSLRRSWDAVYRLEGERSREKFSNHRVDAFDMSAAFDRIVSLTTNSSAHPAFAPFGPKPLSAAMCLYAAQRNAAVYYPQPKSYNPDYSIGIAEIDGQKAIHAYWVKHAGVSFYQLPG